MTIEQKTLYGGKMKPYEKDLDYIRISIGELEEYILSGQLYWPLGSGPRLTIGNLLFSKLKLSTYPLQGEDQGIFSTCTNQIDALRSQWFSNWRQKAIREYSARYALWASYLRELFDDIDDHSFSYHHDVRWRVLLEILKPEFYPQPMPAKTDLTVLDKNLRSITHPGEFIWEANLADCLPREKYWFLYISFQKSRTED